MRLHPIRLLSALLYPMCNRGLVNHSKNLGMAVRRKLDVMKARIAASSVQTERVQNALCASLMY